MSPNPFGSHFEDMRRDEDNRAAAEEFARKKTNAAEALTTLDTQVESWTEYRPDEVLFFFDSGHTQNMLAQFEQQLLATQKAESVMLKQAGVEKPWLVMEPGALLDFVLGQENALQFCTEVLRAVYNRFNQISNPEQTLQSSEKSLQNENFTASVNQLLSAERSMRSIRRQGEAANQFLLQLMDYLTQISPENLEVIKASTEGQQFEYELGQYQAALETLSELAIKESTIQTKIALLKEKVRTRLIGFQSQS